MIALWRRSTRLGKILFPAAIAVFVAQLFFVADYANDKTAMVEQMARSYRDRGGLVGRDIRCRDFATGEPGVRPRWAEEFPVFHYAAVGFAELLPGETWRRWTPWFFHALAWLLVGALWFRHGFGARPEFLEGVALYGFLPIVVIHATKAVPDPAAVAAALAGALVFLSGRRAASLPLFALAGATKPLALALIGPFALGWMIAGEGPARARAREGLAVGAAALLGIAAWTAFLLAGDVDNPLLRDAAYRASAAATAPIGDPVPFPAYLARYFTWIAARGLSWPGFLAAIAGTIGLLRGPARAAPLFVRLAIPMAIFSPVYWLLVRGPQYTGPWYSLYVVPGLATVALVAYFRLPRTWMRAAFAALVIASAIPKVEWRASALEAYRAARGTAFANPGDGIDCRLAPILRAVF